MNFHYTGDSEKNTFDNNISFDLQPGLIDEKSWYVTEDYS